MKRKIYFYGLIVCLTILDAVLLSSPNLLGKIGLFIYKYSYLKTFPRTLLTVSIAVLFAIGIAEFIGLLVKNKKVKRAVGMILLLMLIALMAIALYKTVIDFSGFTYAHTGLRFRYGAYLLPCLLILIFGYQIFNLPKVSDSLKVPDTSAL